MYKSIVHLRIILCPMVIIIDTFYSFINVGVGSEHVQVEQVCLKDPEESYECSNQSCPSTSLKTQNNSETAVLGDIADQEFVHDCLNNNQQNTSGCDKKENKIASNGMFPVCLFLSFNKL